MLLRRWELLRNQGNGLGDTCFDAAAAAGTLFDINNTVLGVRSACRADIKTEAFFGTEPKVSDSKFLLGLVLHNFKLPVRNGTDRAF